MKTSIPATNPNASSSLLAPARNRVLRRFRVAPVLAAGLLLAAGLQAQPVLLTDNFNSGNTDPATFNNTLAADQGGTLATISYTIGGSSALTFQVQHGNGSKMILYGPAGDYYASLNHNFAVEANAANKPLKLQFDLNIDQANNVADWATFAIGSTQNLFVNNATNKFSSLFRYNGGSQQFASGADVSSGLTWTPSGSTIAVILSDTNRTGSAFNGNGSVARLYVNGTLKGTWTLAQLGSGDGYISFEAAGAFAHYDNLSISLVPYYTVTYSANGSTSGTAPTDANSPYATNSTVTVLGNTGTLAKTGYSFGGWNTAADGSGSNYAAGTGTFTIAANTTLYARWIPVYTVTYNGNGNDSGSTPTDGSSPYLTGSTVTVLGNTGTLGKTGENFGGWNTAADGSGTAYSGGATFTITSNTVLYARWVSGYTVTYDGNGNTGGSVPVDGNAYSGGASATVLNPNTLFKTGNSFVNWNTAANGTGASYAPSSSLTVNANTTLYAQWALNQYTATYLAGTGGTISGTATQTVNYGTSTTSVTATPNAGYHFTGWSDGVATATRSDVNFLANFTVNANFDNNLTWNNGAGTFAWNQSDTNWTGAVWSNGVSDTAIFAGSGSGTITLQQDIIASNVRHPWSTAGYVLNGGGYSLQVLGDLSVIGTTYGEPGMTLSNGVFNLNRVVTASSGGGDWGKLNIASGAAVTVTNGIDGSVGSPYTFALNLNGGTLTTPSIKVADWHAGSVDAYLTFNGTEVIAAADNTNFIQTYGDFGNNNSLTVGSGGAILNTAGHNVTINPSLIGSGSLTKTGNGTLTLSATNTYTGNTTISGGVLDLSTGIIYQNGGFVDRLITINHGGKAKVSSWGDANAATAGGFGQVGFGAGNILLDNGAIEYVGGAASGNMDRAFTIGAGGATLIASGSDTWQLTYVNRGWGTFPLASSGGTLTLDGSANGLISQAIPGTGGVTKSGSGTWTLAGTNTYTGKTVVQGGVLSIGAANALGSGAVDITNGAVLNLNYNGQAIVSALVLDGVNQPYGTYGATGSGASTIDDTHFTGTGVLHVFIPPASLVFTWTGAQNNNWDESTANWTNGAAYNQWFNNSAAPNSALFDLTGIGQSSVNVALGTALYASNVTFNAAGYSIGGSALTLGNTPTLTVNSNATIGNVLLGSGGLTKTGNAKLTLTGINHTYTGNTTVRAGTLEIGASGGFDANSAGGAVTVSNGATILISSTANNALAFQGGTPAWTVAGTVNVTGGGANTIPTSGVVLNGGTLTGTSDLSGLGTFLDVQGSPTIVANGAGNTISTADFGVQGGETLTLHTPLSGDSLTASTVFFDLSFGGNNNPRTLAKTGAGTATLSGASTFTGGLTVSAGRLLVNGSVTSGATVSGGTLAGSGSIGGVVTVNAGGTIAAGAVQNGIGTLTVNNNLTLNGNVLVNLQKGLAQSNSMFAVSGILTNANGAATTLTVSNLGPALVVGDKFTVFSKALAGGVNVTIVPPTGYTFNNHLATDGSISVATVPGPVTLGYTQSGNSLTFTWAGSGSLEWQTNALSKGLGTNWVAYPNGTNGVTVPVDATKGSVFFRVKQ